MARTCVDVWLKQYVARVVKNHGMGAHDILFNDRFPVIGGGKKSLFDAITSHLQSHKPELHAKIRARVFAVTKYNGNPNEVCAVLSM